MMLSQIGVLGLGTMGKALLDNLLGKGFRVSGYNRSAAVLEKMKGDKNFLGFNDVEAFVLSLEKPRKIILMLTAGEIVDVFIEKLLLLLEPGDILMDGGNSYFKDTNRRYEKAKEANVHFFGVGVSGGEKGARFGPSIMPGGDKEVYKEIAPYLQSIAAKKNGDPCCAYIGPMGAGHYVKMVHNGIEYADMQLIVEIYLYLKYVCKKTNEEMAEVFDELNRTEAKSYLIEITHNILLEKDSETQNYLVDMISDVASQKGTGKWTVLEAVDSGQNVSLIQSALSARNMSNLIMQREVLGKQIEKSSLDTVAEPLAVDDIKKAYYLAKIVAYAQGFAQMKEASKIYGWDLDLSEIASIFRAGCIIQAELLEVLREDLSTSSDLDNVLLNENMIKKVNEGIGALRKINLSALHSELATPVLSAAIVYLDQLKASALGANLIQAQRDFFGAHTFVRTDREGAVHHEWKGR